MGSRLKSILEPIVCYLLKYVKEILIVPDIIYIHISLLYYRKCENVCLSSYYVGTEQRFLQTGNLWIGQQYLVVTVGYA